MPQEVCLSCWHLWRPRRENPRECPKCHSRKTTSLWKIVDAVESVSEWLKTDPLLECFFSDEINWKELKRRLESKRHHPLELINSAFRAVKSVPAFQRIAEDTPIPSREGLDARRVILEIAGEFVEEEEKWRIGDFVERYIENMAE